MAFWTILKTAGMMHHRRAKANQHEHGNGGRLKSIPKGDGAEAMVSLAKVILAAGTAGGVLFGLALFGIAGAPWALALAGGLMAGGCSAALLQSMQLRREAALLRDRLEAVRADMAEITARDAAAGARLVELERRTVESPALVWRAASAEFEVLGTLVSEIARNIAEHERRLSPPDAAGGAGEGDSLTADAKPGKEGGPPALDLAPDRDGALSFEAKADTQPHPAVVAELRGILASALASDRLELCLQPVVELPQRKIRGYEATLRLRGESDDLQSEADLRRIASTTGLEAELDGVLIERALHVLRVLRGRKREVTISCAVAAAGLLSPRLPAALETALRSDPELARTLILELTYQEFCALSRQAREALRALADRGVGLSLGRLPHLKLDIDAITVAGIRQIKVAAAAMLGDEDAASRTDIHPADMAEFLRRRGIEMQMSDVASEQTVVDCLDYAPPLASGPLFGAARPVRPEVIEPRAVSEAGAVETRKPVPPGTEEAGRTPAPPDRPLRQSFRSVLRRA